jgi:RNA polymerase sigma factor (sigma-70 family)
MATDSELLQEFVRHKSDAAFAEIVSRYSNLVFAAARRQVSEPHLAEDVTQTAFIVLARRAESVSAPRLAAWLLVTTRLCALDAIKKQNRRSHYEQEAALQKSEVSEPVEPIDPQIPKLLDEALTYLRPRDCTAVAMRYLQDKPVSEVAAAIGVTPNAAQKILSRSLVKLRNILGRRGIAAPSIAILTAALLHESAQTAPAALAAACAAPELASTPQALAVSKAIGHGMTIAKIKIAALAAAIFLVIPAAAVVIHSHIAKPSAAPQAQAALDDSAPAPSGDDTPAASPVDPTLAAPGKHILSIPNDSFVNYSDNPDQFQMGVDPDTRRASDSPPASFVQATSAVATRGVRFYAIPTGLVGGRTVRIRIAGWMKSQDVEKTCGLNVIVMGPDGKSEVVDKMEDRPIRGTTDWKQYYSVVEVPPDAREIVLKIFLRGAGEVWADDFQIDEVGKDVAATDDSNWRLTGKAAGEFTAAIDPDELRDGQPAFRIGSTTARRKQSANYQRTDRAVQKYAGHRIKVSAWMKSEEVLADAGIQINVMNDDEDSIADDGQSPHRPVRNTTDWKLYTAYADVPKNAASIQWGFILNGGGNIWVDLDSAKLEIADGPGQ